MSQLDGYLQALLPEPTQVLGLSLKPFSLAHLNMLQRKQCTSFINGFSDKSAGSLLVYVNDFLTTVIVCAMTYEEVKEADEKDVITLCTRKWNKDKTFREIYHKAIFSEYVERWNKELETACNNKSVNMLQEMEKMKQYIKDSFTVPESYPIEDGADKSFTSGVSWEQSLRDFLLTRYSESEAMNLPLSLAFWEWTREAEKNRQVSMKSQADVDAIAILKTM